MEHSMRFLAFLGAVLIGAVALMLLPETPAGRTFAFAAFWIALYPLATTLWFSQVPAWRFWAALGVGAAIGWSLDTWRTAGGMSSDANHLIARLVFASATVALLYGLWRGRPGDRSAERRVHR
ncbi:hypothetical protein BH23ACI1_BH23ACI1_03050 [soil metagenome]